MCDILPRDGLAHASLLHESGSRLLAGQIGVHDSKRSSD